LKWRYPPHSENKPKRLSEQTVLKASSFFTPIINLIAVCFFVEQTPQGWGKVWINAISPHQITDMK